MSHFQLQAVAIKEKIKMAIHEYLQIKKQADRQDNLMSQIIQAQAKQTTQ